ncbi:MAG: biotin--[acetyl-CoA-carboxylase] ligase [Candidatus Ratteibacteria bacterium]|nr:biotin--[acetyl-CoA-carboxylase] ligase [Candidatus Ratteibacteria bacterium]
MKDVGKVETCEEIEGVSVYYLGTVTSTMDVAEDFLRNGKTGIVVAEQQERGRGRYGKKWFSPAGGLYLSWILKEEKVFLFLSEILTLSIIKTLQHFGIGCRIKLPNDIIVDSGKKIAGILIVKKDTYYIAGIGININNPVEDRMLQVAVRDILRRELEKKVVLGQLIKDFQRIKDDFCKSPDDSLKLWGKYLIK